MALRTAHGNATTNGIPGPRVEVLPADELPYPNAVDTADGHALAEVRGRPFAKGNKAGAGRKPALVSLGVRVEDAKDPEYLRQLRSGARYRKRRVAELCALGGGEISAGVSLRVKHEAMAAVGAEWIFNQAAKENLPVKERVELLLQMDRLAQGSKQHALCAWELTMREANERRERKDLKKVAKALADAL